MKEKVVPDPAPPVADSPFKLKVKDTHPVRRRLLASSYRILERLLVFDDLDRMYAEVLRNKGDKDFLATFLSRINVSFELSDVDRSRIPTEGPVVVVANHPYGGIEGVTLCMLLKSVRPDVKILSNFLLHRIPEMRDYCFFVDPFGSRTSKRTNLAPIREAIEWVRGGKMLMVFPSGEVSHISWRHKGIEDPKWSPTIARIIRITGAPVLPVFIDGHNGPMFQVAGLIHPRLRTLMLPREMMRIRDRSIRFAVGNLVRPEKMALCSSDDDIIDYLRFRTYILRHRFKRGTPIPPWLAALRHRARRELPIAPPESSEVMASEVARLPESQKLIESGGMTVHYANARQIPHLLLEIGRLREIAFRLEHEGTGHERDLDRFDTDYLHLFVWQNAKKEVVGAYRLGLTDRILARRGKRGLYTSTLFRYKTSLLRKIGPALEMGRSFVRPEYQRSYSSLLLLWKGIGRFVALNPRYYRLFGPVSISNEYRSVSKWLLTAYLRHTSYEDDLARLIKPRRPPRDRPARECPQTVFHTALADMETISSVISDIEGPELGVPILMKQYLRLGGRLLGFNCDPDFGDVIDGLLLLDLHDLHRNDPKQLEHFLGRDGVKMLMEHREPESGIHGPGLMRTPRFLRRPGVLLKRWQGNRRRRKRAKDDASTW